MNTEAEVSVWIAVGAAAGWLAGRIVGTDARRGARANVFIGVIGALVAGLITRALLANLGYENLDAAGVAGALFGACVLVFGWHGFSYRQVSSAAQSQRRTACRPWKRTLQEWKPSSRDGPRSWMK